MLSDQAEVTKYEAQGVVHGSRGRPCKKKTREKTVKRIVELARGRCQDLMIIKLKKEQKRSDLLLKFYQFSIDVLRFLADDAPPSGHRFHCCQSVEFASAKTSMPRSLWHGFDRNELIGPAFSPHPSHVINLSTLN